MFQDLPPPSAYHYQSESLERRLHLYQKVSELYSEYYQLCQADGDSDRDQDRGGYGRRGGCTDFDHHREVSDMKWEAAKEIGKGIVSAYAGDMEGALQSFASGLEMEVEAWKKDVGGAIDGVQDFFSRD
jgi:hypothetical protein